ncbi:WXG100 family type VII secretion target [Nocardia sp. NPDC127579]|uniref:WXG100 family type VII secretion target n=1 Tax=Nocardia sp. NPDC127579 TaxID=3345402 RepID=UPI00363351BA
MPNLDVTPGQLRGAAGRMADLRDRVDGVRRTLESALAVKGSAWGADGYGSTFADGPEGYLAAHDNLLLGLADTAATLGSYADGQLEAAALLARTDQSSIR